MATRWMELKEAMKLPRATFRLVVWDVDHDGARQVSNIIERTGKPATIRSWMNRERRKVMAACSPYLVETQLLAVDYDHQE